MAMRAREHIESCMLRSPRVLRRYVGARSTPASLASVACRLLSGRRGPLMRHAAATHHRGLCAAAAARLTRTVLATGRAGAVSVMAA